MEAPQVLLSFAFVAVVSSSKTMQMHGAALHISMHARVNNNSYGTIHRRHSNTVAKAILH